MFTDVLVLWVGFWSSMTSVYGESICYCDGDTMGCGHELVVGGWNVKQIDDCIVTMPVCLFVHFYGVFIVVLSANWADWEVLCTTRVLVLTSQADVHAAGEICAGQREALCSRHSVAHYWARVRRLCLPAARFVLDKQVCDEVRCFAVTHGLYSVCNVAVGCCEHERRRSDCEAADNHRCVHREKGAFLSRAFVCSASRSTPST